VILEWQLQVNSGACAGKIWIHPEDLLEHLCQGFFGVAGKPIKPAYTHYQKSTGVSYIFQRFICAATVR